VPVGRPQHRKTVVTKQLRNLERVHALLEQMGCEGMPEDMRVNPLGDLRLIGQASQHQLDAALGKAHVLTSGAAATAGDKEPRSGGVLGTALLCVGLETLGERG